MDCECNAVLQERADEENENDLLGRDSNDEDTKSDVKTKKDHVSGVC